jgi:hypothetical protein
MYLSILPRGIAPLNCHPLLQIGRHRHRTS